jgi:hypothetical protein
MRIVNKWATIGLIFFAFGMSAFVSRSVFERLPHLEDEVAYLYQAKIFAGGQLVVESPQPRRSFWQPFVVDYSQTGQRFAKYTPGWPLLLTLGVWSGQAWLLNALLAALTVALTYRIGRELFNADVGLIAAALMAFSPAALLLNASLMGHTSALFFTTLFIFAYLQLEKLRGYRALLWGLIAGVALGWIVITRPLSAIAVALPLIVYSAARLLLPVLLLLRDKAKTTRQTAIGRMWRTLQPLLLLSVVTLLLAAIIPIFNYTATGDPTKNLYTLVWPYDRIGFGECCGRNGHTLEKAIRHHRFDLSLTAADLFGWQLGQITPEIQEHLRTSSVYYPHIGLSFVLLPFGFLVGLLWGARSRVDVLRRLLLLLLWALVALAWVLLPVHYLDTEAIRDPTFSWLWIIAAFTWILLPLFGLVATQNKQVRWTWLLISVLLGVVVAQMSYWIGSQRYSTRYLYEALTAAALLSALPLAWVARRNLRWLLYPLVAFALLYSLTMYSTPRISALYRFNRVNADLLAEVEARREDDQPVLVLVTGPGTGDERVRWRAMGTFMAVTGPYLDSDIVLAWDYGGVREQILSQFPERQVIEMTATRNFAAFVDDR